MMKTSGLTSLTLLLVLPFVLSGPVPDEAPLFDSSRKFQYEVGQTYTYAFETNTKTNVAHSSASEDAVLSVKGEALLTFRTLSDVSIELTKTSIQGLDSKAIDSSALEKFPTLMVFQDGSIESIYSHPNDAAWVVNIKRAILSMFQHSALHLETSGNFFENDVVGRCDTEYIAKKDSNSVKVMKTKVPNKCSRRQGRESSMLTVAYDAPAELQNLPLLNSTSTCEQQITDFVIVSVMCKEAHLFRPLSSELRGGARTEATSSITFVQKKRAKSLSINGIVKKSDLIFDHSATKLEMNMARNIDTIVNSLCNQLADDSPAGSSELFTELVRSMRAATPKAVKASYNNLLNKKNCKENKKTEMMFLDALPQAGSTASVMLMSELLQDGKISSRQSLGWYLSLPLAKFVTIDVVRSLVPMVEAAKKSPVALLGISGMVRRLCIKNIEECQKSKDVLLLSDHLAKLINHHTTDDTETLISLKALGNMGVMSEEVMEDVAAFINVEAMSVPVRVAAVEAFRNMPCTPQLNQKLLKSMKGPFMKDEVAIAAYLSIMRCPTVTDLSEIEDYLRQYKPSTETVRSFIRSHLTNIRQNPTPGMQHARELVKKMSFDSSPASGFAQLGHTRNSVASHFCAANNLGFNADLNVIYSEESKIPRSAALNLTLDIFGQSVNLFEIGARAENLDKPLAALVRKYLDRESILFKGDDESEVKLDAFVRVFGTEIGMLAYRGADVKSSFSDLQTRISQALRQLMEGAKKVDVDVARSFMFLDSSVTFPTVAGMPIRLAVNGSTTVALGLESQLDIASIMRDPRNFDVRVKVSPFAVTQLSASMTVDMSIAETGIKVASTIHSSAAADFSATRKQMKQLEVRLDLPKSKITLIDFSSNLLRVYRAGDDNQVMKIAINNEMEYKHGGCSNRLTPITGLRLCAQSRLNVPSPLANPKMDPVPSFPLSGHGAFSIVLEKTDSSMKGYHLKLDVAKYEPSESRSLPEHIILEGTMSASPKSEFRFETEMRNSKKIKSASLKITRNNRDYYAKVQVDADKQKDLITYSSTVEIEHPDQPRVVIFQGKVGHRLGKSLEISMIPTGPFARVPMQLQATLSREMTAAVTKLSMTDVNIMTPLGRAVINTAEINIQTETSVVVFDMSYGAEKHSVVFDGHVSMQPTVFKSAMNYKSSRFPSTNIGVSYMRVKEFGLRSNKLVVTHGPESEQTVNRLTLSQSLNLGKMEETRFDNHFEVTYPRFGVAHKIDQTFNFDSERMIAVGSFNYEANNKRIIESTLRLPIFLVDEPGTIYKLDFMISYLDKILNIQDVGKQISENQYVSNPMIKIQAGSRKYEITGKVTGLLNDDGTSVSLEADVSGHGISSPMKFFHSSQFTDDMVFTTTNKLNIGGKPRFSFDTKVFPRLPSIETKVFVVDAVDGKFSLGFFVNQSTSRREPKLDVDILFFRTQRRIKTNAYYREENNGLVRNAYGQIQLDADKNPNQQMSLLVSVENKSQLSERAFNIRTTWVVDGRPSVLLVSTKRTGFETMKALVELEVPDKEKRTLAIGNTFNAQSTSFKNEFELKIDETYKVNIVVGIDGTHFDHTKPHNLIFVTDIQSSLHEDIKIKLEFDHSTERKTGDKIEAKLQVEAPKYVVANDFEIFTKVEYDRRSFLVKSGYTRNHGNVVVFLGEVGGSMNFQDRAVRKIRGHTNLQITEFPKVEISLEQDSSTDISIYTMNQKLKLMYGGEIYYTQDQSIKFTETSMEVIVDGMHAPTNVRQGCTIRSNFDLPRIDGSISVTWSGVPAASSRPMRRRFKSRNTQVDLKEVRFDIEAVVFPKDTNSLTLKLNAATPFEGLKSSKLSVEFTKPKANDYMLNVIASLEEIESRMSFNLNTPPGKIDADLKLNLPALEAIHVALNLGYGATFTFKNRVEYGQAYLLLDGTMTIKSSENFEFNMLVDSPALGVNKYEIYGQNLQTGRDRAIEFAVKKMGTTLGNLRSTYKEKITRALKEYQGTAEFNVVEPQMAGSIKYIFQNKITRNGNQYILKINSKELGSVTANVKSTQYEKIALIETCSNKQGCDELDFSFIDNSKLKKKALTLLLKSKSKRSSSTETRGIRASHSSVGNTFEQIFEVIISEVQSKKIGYKASRKENTYDLEVFTNKRSSALNYEISLGANKEKKHTISVWADRTKFPQRQLNIIFTSGFSKKNAMNGFKSSLTFKHPLLPRDIKMEMEHHASNGEYRSETILDFDVFDSVHKRWVVINKVLAWNDNKVNILTELSSKGTEDSIVLEYKRDIAEAFTASANLKFKSKDTIEKELFMSLDASSNSFLFRLGSPQNQFSVDTRLQYAPSRFNMKTTTNVFGLSPSTFLVSYDKSQFEVLVAVSELSYQVTAVTDGAFKLALVRNDGHEKLEILSLSFELDTNDLLTSRLYWKGELLDGMRMQVESRLDSISYRSVDVVKKLIEDLKVISSKWAAFKNLRPGLKSLATDAGKEFENFIKDSNQDESLQVVLSVLRMISESFDVIDLSDACDMLEQELMGLVEKYFAMLRNLTSYQLSQLRRFVRDMKTYFLKNEHLLPAIKQWMHKMSQTLNVFAHSMDEYIQQYAEWFDSFSSGEGSAFTSLKEALSQRIYRLEKHIGYVVEHYKAMVEELVFIPYDELYALIVAIYPESTRFLYRNVDVYVQMIRTAIKETDYHNQKVAEIKRMFKETQKVSPVKNRKLATEFVNNLYSMAGKFVVYDIPGGEIRHELPLNGVRYAASMLMVTSDKNTIELPSTYFSRFLERLSSHLYG